MNTVGKDKGVYPTAAWKKKILLAEHSPIRLMQFAWKWSDLPYWVSVHIVRHKIGIEHFVSTQRTDRTGVDRTGGRRTPRCSTSARRMRRRSSRSAASASAPAQALKRGRRGSFSRTRSQRSSRSLPPAWCASVFTAASARKCTAAALTRPRSTKRARALPRHSRSGNNENAFSGRRRRFRYQRSLAEFAPAGAKNGIIFSGDMCVGENTLRLANVRAQASAAASRSPFKRERKRSGSRLRTQVR